MQPGQLQMCPFLLVNIDINTAKTYNVHISKYV